MWKLPSFVSFLKNIPPDIVFYLVFGLIYSINAKFHSVWAAAAIQLGYCVIRFFFHGNKAYERFVIVASANIMLIISLLSAELSFSTSIFIYFMHRSLIHQLLSMNPVCLVTILSESLFLYDLSSNSSYISSALMLLSLVSQVSIVMLTEYNVIECKYPAKLVIFALIVDCALGIKVQKSIFYVSVLLSNVCYPDFIKEVFPTQDNVKYFSFLVTSYTLNINNLYYGLKIGSPILISSAEISLYNTISFTTTLAGNLISKRKNSQVFSFGCKNSVLLLKLVGLLIVLTASFNLFSSTLFSIGCPDIYVKNPLHVVFYASLDFVLTIAGAIMMGKEKITLFALLTDVALSSSALISALFDKLFGLPQMDTFVSLFDVAQITTTTVPEIIDTLKRILRIEDNEKIRKIIASTFDIEIDSLNVIYIYAYPRNEICLSCHVEPEREEEVLNEMEQFFNSRNVASTIEFR